MAQRDLIVSDPLLLINVVFPPSPQKTLSPECAYTCAAQPLIPSDGGGVAALTLGNSKLEELIIHVLTFAIAKRDDATPRKHVYCFKVVECRRCTYRELVAEHSDRANYTARFPSRRQRGWPSRPGGKEKNSRFGNWTCGPLHQVPPAPSNRLTTTFSSKCLKWRYECKIWKEVAVFTLYPALYSITEATIWLTRSFRWLFPFRRIQLLLCKWLNSLYTLRFFVGYFVSGFQIDCYCNIHLLRVPSPFVPCLRMTLSLRVNIVTV